MLKTGGSIFARAAARAVGQAPRHLAAHLLAVALGALALWPLFALLRDRLVRLSGDRAVADFGIAEFLLTPEGMASLFVLAAVLIALAVFEIATMMTIDLAARRGAPAGAIMALRFVAMRVPAILGFGLRLAVRLAVLVVPALLVAALVARSFLTDHDINYYLAFRPPEFRNAALLIGLLAALTAGLVIRMLFHWALALPLVLFSEMPAGAAFGRSRELVQGNKRALIAALGVWFAATTALALAAGGLLYLFGHAVMPGADAGLRALTLALGLTGLLFLAVRTALQTFQNASFATILTDTALKSAPDLLTRPLPARAQSRADRGLPGWIAGAGVALGVTGLAGAASLTTLGAIATGAGDAQVIAHRAGAAAAPENTAAAVEGALADRADWLEIDVQETADGTVVVIHDRDLMRQAGMARDVHLLTPDEVAAIDIGSWFGAEFADQRLMTLGDALAAVKGKAKLLIELKHYGHAVLLEERVIDAVERAGMAEAVATMSLDAASVARMKALRPDWPAGLLVARALGDLTALQADFLAVNAAIARPALIRHAHAAGQSVHVWTLNTPEAMRAMLLRGVDGMITDRPALAGEVRAEIAALTPAGRLLLALGIVLGLAGGA